MPNSSPSYVNVNPSFTEPGLLLPYTQASGAFDCLGGGEPLTRLSDGDLYVYVNRIDVRTKVASGTAAYNQLPSVDVILSQISTPSYLLRVRAEYDHHDTAAMARRGVSIVEAQRLGMRQGHFQLARNALLYGMNPQNGEGLLNAAGATAISLPPDSNGNQTAQTYDSGQMAFFLLSQISAMKSRTNQLGIGRKFTVLGPQRVLSIFEYQGIVQLVQFQRQGAGSETTTGVVGTILMANGDQITWAYDDTLQGKGAGGTDAILIVMPEIEKPDEPGINTNEFAKLSPGIGACVTMYCDMAAPREIVSPLAGGATDMLTEWRITSGWAMRPESVTVVSMAPI